MNLEHISQELYQNSVAVQEIAAQADRIYERSSVARSKLLEFHAVTDKLKLVAEQSKILSINARIEAAHLGHVGRASEVIADEIRLLSEVASEASKLIESLIKDVITLATGNTDEVKEMRDKLQAEAAIIQEITATVHELRDCHSHSE